MESKTGNALHGKIYNIQGFSVQDGPGVRTTVFLKGCPLRCPWCHSPESQEFGNQLLWISMKCIGTDVCGRCIAACPQDAISNGRIATRQGIDEEIQLVHVDRATCNTCGACSDICYSEALTICGQDYTVDDLLAKVVRDRPFYTKSGGGVTLSGGEPLSQPKFTIEVLKRLKLQGIHTALDTTGYVSWQTLEKSLPFTDLYLYDIKHMDDRKHLTATGVSNSRIISNVRRLALSGGKLQIRIPLIPHFNDDGDNIYQTACLCKELGDAIHMVQILPYHTLGTMKYERLNDDAKILEAIPHTDDEIERVRLVFEDLDVPVSVH